MDALRLGPKRGARCLVIGGCGDIGRAYVQGLVESGARVAVLDIAPSLHRAALPPGVIFQPIDVCDEKLTNDTITSIGEEWDGFDVFVYVSGINPSRETVENVSIFDLRATLDVNLVGAFIASRAAMPFLRRSGDGVMLFVSSGLAVHAEKGFGPYSASKGGLNMLMKTLAKEGAPSIRVNAIAPGLVDTVFLSDAEVAADPSQSAADAFLERLGDQGRAILASIPLGRIAKVDDIVGPMLFLSGPASRFMTAQTVHVNGGRHSP